MFVQSSSKAVRIWLLLAIILSLDLVRPGFALKCYSCNGRVDCLVKGNLDKETECETGYNACLTAKGDKGQISKFCWMHKNEQDTEGPGHEPGFTYYYCYKDLCNAGDYANGRSGSSTTEKSGSAVIQPPILTLTTGITGCVALGVLIDKP